MSKLNQTQLERYRRLLEAIKDRLRSDTSSVVEQSREASGGQAGGQLSNAPLHLGDNGTDEFLYDMNATLMENEQYLLGETLDAERRIDEGTFGQCESCGKPIKKERLDVMPYARFCVMCAETHDAASHQGNINTGRPNGPRDTIAPEGEMQENHRLRETTFSDEAPMRARSSDVHAAGTAGGGTSMGGLAGTNIGHGDPTVSDLQDAAGSGNQDSEEARGENRTPKSGPTGGAVGGTPARKRST